MTSLAALVIIITIIIIIENGSDLRSNELYLSSSENKAKKNNKFKPARDLNPAIPVQRPTS